jgi:AraC-like DNA-binding protein
MSNIVNIHLDELCPYVRNAGKQNLNSWKNRFRKIYDHEYMYCRKGKAYINIEGREYKILPGTLILIKPDREHSIWIDDKDPADILWVHFDYIYRKDVYRLNSMVKSDNSILYHKFLPRKSFIRPEPKLDNSFTFPEVLQIVDKKAMDNIFTVIVKSFEEREVLYELECKARLIELYKIVIQQCTMKNKIMKTFDRTQAVDSVIKYIQANYHRKISMHELSEITGYNGDYLGKIFKKKTGSTLIQYITLIRIENAQQLLKQTDLSITNIAEMTGFCDVYHLSHSMKKQKGVSPSALREV